MIMSHCNYREKMFRYEGNNHDESKTVKTSPCIAKIQWGLLSQEEAAEALRLSERQITRLAKGMREQGGEALIHKNTGRKPAHAITAVAKEKIINIRACLISPFRHLFGKFSVMQGVSTR